MSNRGKHKSLKPLSEEELAAWLNPPAKKGLEKILRFEVLPPGASLLQESDTPSVGLGSVTVGSLTPDSLTRDMLPHNIENTAHTSDFLQDAGAKTPDTLTPGVLTTPSLTPVSKTPVSMTGDGQAEIAQTTPESLTTEILTPTLASHILDTPPESKGPESKGPAKAQTLGATIPPSPTTDSLLPNILPVYRVSRPRAMRWTEAQDAHTSTEQAVYLLLWRHGIPHDTVSRKASMTMDFIAGETKVVDKSVRRVIAKLIQKLAIEQLSPGDPGRRIPKTWRIFNYTEINNRRRRAGLTYVIRERTAVELVSVDSVETSLTPVSLTLDILAADTPDNLPTDVLLENRTTGVSLSKTTGVSLSAPSSYREETSREGKTTTSSVVALSSLLNVWIAIDDQAVEMLWHTCKQGTPDCTPDEVNEFARTKLPLIQSGKIDNPTGLLIRQVPKFFQNGGSMALKQRREAVRRRREEEERRQKELRQQQQQILNDPNATDEDKEWARQMLSDDE